MRERVGGKRRGEEMKERRKEETEKREADVIQNNLRGESD